jgi:predicted DNA-binding ribbon-helix-helix protein
MSYMSVIPNCYYGNTNQMGQVAAHYLNSQTIFNNKAILNYLTSALRISVANYQQTQQSNTLIDPSQPEIQLSQTPTTQPLSNPLELPLSSQENKEIN